MSARLQERFIKADPWPPHETILTCEKRRSVSRTARLMKNESRKSESASATIEASGIAPEVSPMLFAIFEAIV
jgi:hypothetical protein